ncbi:MAG: hypothetical protein H6525_04770 [Actinobacteria bacterium]|nr:hypothetical protein [Actinomycetota bacterium]
MSITRELPSSVIDAPALRRRRDVRRVRYTFTVGVIATAIGLVAGVVSMRSGVAVSYADSDAHLTIARRLWDGEAPGLGQLGTVWLPIPHLLLAPFTLVALIDPDLWRLGLPGVLLSSVCLGVTAAALFRIMRRMGITSLVVATVGLAVFVLNPAILLLHSTAMTEPVLLAGVAMATSGISGFIASERPLSGGEMLVYVGLPTGLAVGSRYDGWGFAAAATLAVAWLAHKRWRSWRYTVRTTIGVILPSVMVATWWVVVNWVQHGDILAFQRGPYSAQFQQEQLESLDLLPTKGSLWVSLDTYAWTAWYALGGVAVILTLAGLAAALIREPFSARTLPMWLLTFTFPFYVLLLTAGQSVIKHAMTTPPGLFNIRHGAPLALVSALAVAYLAQSLADPVAERISARRTGTWLARRAAVVAAGIVGAPLLALTLAGYATAAGPGISESPALAEVEQITEDRSDLDAATQFLRARLEPGQTVLIDESVNPSLTALGIDFDSVSARFTPDFESQLRDPTADWVLCRTGPGADEVCRAAATEPLFAQRYSLAFRSGDRVVLQRVE